MSYFEVIQLSSFPTLQYNGNSLLWFFETQRLNTHLLIPTFTLALKFFADKQPQ